MATTGQNTSYVNDAPNLNRAKSNTISDLIYRYYRDAAGLVVPFAVEAEESEEVKAEVEQTEKK